MEKSLSIWNAPGQSMLLFLGMRTLLIATRNMHKACEIKEILTSDFNCLTLKEFPDAPEVIEDAPTFIGNATKKAVALAKWAAMQGNKSPLVRPGFVLADDSGLEVDALGGAPGVHSARFAATDHGSGNCPDPDNNAKLLRLLRDVPPQQRTGRFRCVLALAPVCKVGPESASPACLADETELLVEVLEGVCEGSIGFEPRGQSGFGYDPLFTPEGFQETFAELGSDVKNRISHRGKALQLLKKRLLRGAEV
jgi:XTP/dITP diphosphohydrolase